MKTIRSLMGRRQFLIAAGISSALGLSYKKIVRFFNPWFESGVAKASLKSGIADIKGSNNRYSHLLSPLKIRNVIVKNRMIHTVGLPHFLQGPETYPSDVVRSSYQRYAKNGAAIVVCPGLGGMGGGMRNRKDLKGDSAHMEMFDTTDPAVENYIDQIAEGVHCYGSLVCTSLRGGTIEETVTQAKLLQDRGVDMVQMGGDSRDKDSARLSIERMQAVKNATNLLIGMRLNVRVPWLPPETGDSHSRSEPTVEDAVATAKMFEGSADILQFRLGAAMGSHPTSFNQERGKPMSLRIAQAIKESGAKIILAPNGGFQDLDLNEEFIATGKCDMITMCRAFHADWEYGKKAYEGRGEDVVPCIMCNKCHGTSMTGPWYSVCSVNPKLGISTAVGLIDAPDASKKVAVIGGGPAGMKAAITAAERGHRVTLYEKDDYLGGLLRHADFNPYKWALKDFKDYLIRQTQKAGIEVFLSTEATPEMIRARGYDAVLAAVGAEPVMPSIPGADESNVWNVANVYGNEKTLGTNVVVIGGGEFGVETGMYLARAGHKVMVLTSDKELLRIDRVHYPEIVMDTYEHLDNFDFITEAIATRISKGRVTYVDGEGNERSINADSVVIYAGLRPRQDEAVKFYGSANNATTNAFFTIGDCTGKAGNVQKSIRSAFFTASQL